MTRRITVTLTEDQARQINKCLAFFCEENNLEEDRPEEDAFITRIFQVINAELVKANS